MPKKEVLQPYLEARGTTATDITTLSALHRHITAATSATTLNLSATANPPSFRPTNSPLSIPSAVHLTGPQTLLRSTPFFPKISPLLAPKSNLSPYADEELRHF